MKKKINMNKKYCINELKKCNDRIDSINTICKKLKKSYSTDYIKYKYQKLKNDLIFWDGYKYALEKMLEVDGTVNTNKPIAYVDMDETMFQYKKSYHEKYSPHDIYPQSKVDFFRNLEPIPGAIEGINKLSEYYNVYILTSPSVHNPLCYMEKRLSVEDHLGFEWCKKLIINPDKSLMKPGLLIDDIDWISKGFDGQQIIFGSNDCPNWEYVVDIAKKLIKNYEK